MTVELRPLGVACNIACHYCYQNPQREAGNFRQSYDIERMKAAISREGGPFTLFGGEPLLLPLADLEELLRWGLEEYGRSGIQTNGILLSDEHIRLFKQYNVDVGISIDGPDELNDLRWHADLEKTRRNTAKVLATIEQLCQHYRSPGLIVTLHRINAAPERLPRLHAWVRQIDAIGVRSMRLHLLEAENEHIRQAYSLTDAENTHALLSFANLQTELKNLRFDVVDEMRNSLLGQDQHTSCVWRACDPYTTEAVHGVEGNGQSSNCGRTNKDGIDFVKSERAGYERYLALYQTPQEHGGCKDCRFFLMCKGQCPGTSQDGDWRNRSELCGVWKQVFTHLEKQLLAQNYQPLSTHPQRLQIEQQMLARWTKGHNSTIHAITRDITEATTHHNDIEQVTNDFFMPPFVRLAFVGEAQRTLWEPRLEAVRTALAHLGVLAVSKHILPLSLVSVSPAEVLTIHNLAASHGLHARLLTPHARREWMVIGAEQSSAHYQQAWNNGDRDTLEILSGIPSCCVHTHTELRQAGQGDLTWPLIKASQPANEAARDVDVHCSPGMNTLLKPLGIDLLGYLPCNLNCEESLSRGSALIALGREAGMTQAMDWLVEMLDWPAEWSALHGIAELKTGIIKCIYNTTFTPEKLTLRYHGHTLATDAVRGLSFAYRKPQNQRRNLVVRAHTEKGRVVAEETREEYKESVS